MTTLKFVQIRPSVDVPFYTYPESYTASIRSRHSFTRNRTVSENRLQATIELGFANAAAVNAFIADSERVAQLEVAKSYNDANGISSVVTRLD